MANNDIIHKNIMLIGDYEELIYFLKHKKERINIFKCCIVNDLKTLDKAIVRSEIKIPVFDQNEDIR